MWNQWDRWGYHPGMDGMGWWGLLHGGVSLLLLIIFVVLGVMLVRALLGSTARTEQAADQERRRSSALDILDSRYARGEIDRDEYLAKKKDLGGE